MSRNLGIFWKEWMTGKTKSIIGSDLSQTDKYINIMMVFQQYSLVYNNACMVAYEFK